MKQLRICLGVVVMLLVSGTVRAGNRHFIMLPDSTYIYRFNMTEARYELASVNCNYYSNGRFDSTVTLSPERLPVSKTINYYNRDLVSEIRTYNYNDGTWHEVQRQLISYDDYRRPDEKVVTVWRDGHWENLNLFTHTYDKYGSLIKYHRDLWREGGWIDFATDSLFYDKRGYLIERSARLTSNGEYHSRLLYTYSSGGQRLSQLRQDYTDSHWVNVARTEYFYNKCGVQIYATGERWSGESWLKDTKTEIFYHYEIVSGSRRIPVCYRGATVMIRPAELERYLKKGACLGECADQCSSHQPAPKPHPGHGHGRKYAPFSIYPNPVNDRFQIKLHDQECPVTRIELLDFSGRVIRLIDNPGQQSLTMDISSLARGNYILRVSSDTVYTEVLTKR